MAGLVALAACRVEDRATTAAGGADTPRVIVDSVFPVEEEIRRFRAARPGAPVTELANASTSRDALVERLMLALAARDTAELSAMLMNAAEFIDLYYPTSIYARPPYRQSPELLWFLMQQNSQKGIGRALARYGGVPPHFEGYTCDPEPMVWGANRFWEQCAVRWSPVPGAPSPFRLFGGIIERDGRFKFVSYANGL
jgi:hypothetical protein